MKEDYNIKIICDKCKGHCEGVRVICKECFKKIKEDEQTNIQE
jgi:hypothetical protein